MSAAGPFLRRIAEGYVHYCPGCAAVPGRSPRHAIYVDTAHPMTGARWAFNGSETSPTFTPSINVVGQCHYFITSGQITYCGDSKHALAGQTVPMVKINDEWEPE